MQLDLALAMAVLHWLAGFIVLAEGLNKIHRTDPLRVGLRPIARFVVLMKVLAWISLVLGAGGAVIRPLVATGHAPMHVGGVLVSDRVSLVDLFVLAGFATLIVRSRFKEG